MCCKCDIELANENAAFLSQLAESHPEIQELDESPEFEAPGVDEQTPILQKAKMRRVQSVHGRKNWFVSQTMRDGRMGTFFHSLHALRRQLRILVDAFDIDFVKESLLSFFHNQVSLFIIPALAVAAFFYYRLGNPSLEFLPTEAPISWWILFCIRSYLTLQLAHVSEYLLVDVLATRSPFSVQVVRASFNCFIYSIRPSNLPIFASMLTPSVLHSNHIYKHMIDWVSSNSLHNQCKRLAFCADDVGYLELCADAWKECILQQLVIFHRYRFVQW